MVFLPFVWLRFWVGFFVVVFLVKRNLYHTIRVIVSIGRRLQLFEVSYQLIGNILLGCGKRLRKSIIFKKRNGNLVQE